MTHICVSNLTIIGSDNGLSPGRRQAIIWTNAGILLIEPLGANFSEILIKMLFFFIQENAFESVVWKRRPSWLGLNVLNRSGIGPLHMTSRHGDAFHITDLSWMEPNAYRQTPGTNVSNAELWCFLLSVWTTGLYKGLYSLSGRTDVLPQNLVKYRSREIAV